MQKIVPHLWFDTEAQAAAEFYVSIFPNSQIAYTQTLHDTPSGDSGVVGFSLNGYDFMAISAGPYFKINPSISFSTLILRRMSRPNSIFRSCGLSLSTAVKL